MKPEPEPTPATPSFNTATPVVSDRIVSLDQFRGYTVLGMFLVNFVGSFDAVKGMLPLLKHHHTFCSYADTIMPHFLFVVGIGYRMTFLRRIESGGLTAAFRHAWHRNLGLLLVAFIVHQLDGRYGSWAQLREVGPWGVLQTAFQRNFFQTLSHIAVTSLWILPMIAARPAWRILYLLMSAAMFHAISLGWYYDWVMHRPGIDGGPLGFLSWTIPMILGTLTYDSLRSRKGILVAWLVAGSAVVMLIGYGLSCLNLVTAPNSIAPESGWEERLLEPPFVPPTRPVNIWTMSQRAGSLSYVTFGAGFSIFVYAVFVVACDGLSLRVGLFRTLGTNALVAYILHDLVNNALQPFMPKDSPIWYVFAGFGVSLGICYLFLRHLERHRLFLRL